MAARRAKGCAYVIYPGTDSQSTSLDDTSDRNVYRRYHELIPGIGAFAIKPRSSNGAQDPHGIDCITIFLRDFLTHQASRFTQTFRINYWTHETIKEPPQVTSSLAPALGGPTATAPDPKPPQRYPVTAWIRPRRTSG